MFNLDFDQCLLRVLREHPAGINEYNLQKILQQPPYCALPINPQSDLLVLFRMHFWLFHNLYKLQSQGRSQATFDLSISTLNIRLQPYTPRETQGLDKHDALQDYYLDLSNLFNTPKNHVEHMLEDAFIRIYTSPEKKQALAYLNLCEPVTLRVIRQRYRQLVQIHHPDKGGDTQKFLQLQNAMDTLKQYYQHKPE